VSRLGCFLRHSVDYQATCYEKSRNIKIHDNTIEIKYLYYGRIVSFALLLFIRSLAVTYVVLTRKSLLSESNTAVLFRFTLLAGSKNSEVLKDSVHVCVCVCDL